MTVAAVAGVEPDEAGLASGLINTSQQIGGALGLAILAAVATAQTDNVLAAGGGPAAQAERPHRGLPRAFRSAPGSPWSARSWRSC